MKELVSVCIPVYNGARYLEECLDSVLSQSYENLEVLVVDDGSTDGGEEVILRYQSQDNRIRLIRNQENLGLVKNWQKCIKQARGEWIKFIFQDDVLAPGCIEKMYWACLTHEVPLCICSREFNIEPSASSFLKTFFTKQVFRLEQYFPEATKLRPQEIAILAKDRLFVNIVGEPIVLFFNKRMVKQVGTFNQDLVQLVDYEFTLRLCLHTEFFFLPEQLVQFRVHSSSETSSNLSNSAIKTLKVRFVEPLLLYHEYLFSPHHKLVRDLVGFKILLLKAVEFYRQNRYQYKLPKEMQSYLFAKYKGLYLLKAYMYVLAAREKVKSWIG